MATNYKWNWAAKPPITDLHNLHGNTPVMVIGGGPSAVEGIKMRPKGCIIVSANHHAFAIGLEPDYMVFNDNPIYVPQLKTLIEGDHGDTVLLSQQKEWTEYRYEGVALWGGGDSGMRAVWTAAYMTQGPVIVTGIDCYQGKNRYFHDDNKANEQIRDEGEQIHVNKWRWICNHRHGFHDHKRIKATSGTLTKVFGQWDITK